jgi:hypothetical protein
MSTLPDAPLLAKMISNVTRAMCATTFVPGDPLERGESLCGQMAMLPLTGQRSFTVVVSSDSRGSRALGAAFFGCDEKQLTQAMVDDSIAELLNMVAGQISGALAMNLTLGLPRRATLADLVSSGGSGIADAALFRSEGDVDLWLWIFENHAATNVAATPSSQPAQRSIFRSLLKKMRPGLSKL